jgi:hypothetical protein
MRMTADPGMAANTCVTSIGVAFGGSERYRWRNQAKCCYCHQGNNSFT